MISLNDYRKVVGNEIVDRIFEKAKGFHGKHIVCVNSTPFGGGVAEMLNSIVFLFNDVGIDFGWRILNGTPDFFNVTKGFHNALQGGEMELDEAKKKLYLETNRKFSVFNHLKHDLVIVHDPQPMALIEFYKKKQPWLLRLHIDLSNPNKEVWDYLQGFMKKYDHVIVSHEDYKKDLDVEHTILYPAIDPLALKNQDLDDGKMDDALRELGVDLSKPIIAQVSRFDKWKDPEGVIRIFERVKKEVDCQLVLLGNLASDDPEGIEIYDEIVKKYDGMEGLNVLVNVKDNDIVVNALQRKSDVIIQKSIKEGFGLVVAEALWKETPVVASNRGGIPLQILDGENGFVHDAEDEAGFAASVVKLLKDKELREKMGKNGKEHVRDNFLITRKIEDWLDLFGRYL